MIASILYRIINIDNGFVVHVLGEKSKTEGTVKEESNIFCKDFVEVLKHLKILTDTNEII